MYGFTQGTNYSVKYYDAKQRDFSYEIDSLLKQFSKVLSPYDSTSEISTFNKSIRGIKICSLFKAVHIAAKEVFEKTNGAFDCTIAPLVNAWGFGYDTLPNVDSLTIDSLMKLVDYSKIVLKGDSLIKLNPAILLDYSAIAQGYSVDVVCKYLDNKDINSYLVEIGGEVKTKGVKPNAEKWMIGIEQPDFDKHKEQKLNSYLPIDKGAIATSGNYRKYYVKEGRRYAHTINPKTGYPVEHNLLSATVYCHSCMQADAYATAFMVMGLDSAIDFVKNNKDIDAYFIYDSLNNVNATFSTPYFKKNIIAN